MDFLGLGLAPWLADTCKQMGYRSPTSIQCQCIPYILKGEDVVGRAQTGSGKTAAFALPILSKLSGDPYGIFALVLTPTRELAFQIDEQFRAFGTRMQLKTAVVVGGLGNLDQLQALADRPHVVIATPGRLAWHIRNGAEVPLDEASFLVLDEADRLFEDCFAPDLAVISEALPPIGQRQTLLFSATMTKAVMDFQKMTLNNARYAEVHSEKDAIVASLDQRYILIPQAVKECYLVHLLSMPIWEDASIIIFTATCKGAEILNLLLTELEIECVTLHSKKTQPRRLAALGKFRGGKTNILVATDVASRGLDIPSVKLVVNYDVPRMTDDYVHRVGRTARAGRGGLALTFVSQYDVAIFKSIEEHVGQQMEEYKEMEEKDVLSNLGKVSAAARMAKVRGQSFDLTTRKVEKSGRKSDRGGGGGGDGADVGGGGRGESESTAGGDVGSEKPAKRRKVQTAASKPKPTSSTAKKKKAKAQEGA
jgi:ATP-dependent RNA helicase DDX49/DBP8